MSTIKEKINQFNKLSEIEQSPTAHVKQKLNNKDIKPLPSVNTASNSKCIPSTDKLYTNHSKFNAYEIFNDIPKGMHNSNQHDRDIIQNIDDIDEINLADNDNKINQTYNNNTLNGSKKSNETNTIQQLKQKVMLSVDNNGGNNPRKCNTNNKKPQINNNNNTKVLVAIIKQTSEYEVLTLKSVSSQLYGLIRGQININETPQQAMERETFEETGIKISVDTKSIKFINGLYIYYTIINSVKEVKLSQEHLSYKWVTSKLDILEHNTNTLIQLYHVFQYLSTLKSRYGLSDNIHIKHTLGAEQFITHIEPTDICIVDNISDQRNFISSDAVTIMIIFSTYSLNVNYDSLYTEVDIDDDFTSAITNMSDKVTLINLGRTFESNNQRLIQRKINMASLLHLNDTILFRKTVEFVSPIDMYNVNDYSLYSGITSNLTVVFLLDITNIKTVSGNCRLVIPPFSRHANLIAVVVNSNCNFISINTSLISNRINYINSCTYDYGISNNVFDNCYSCTWVKSICNDHVASMIMDYFNSIKKVPIADYSIKVLHDDEMYTYLNQSTIIRETLIIKNILGQDVEFGRIIYKTRQRSDTYVVYRVNKHINMVDNKYRFMLLLNRLRYVVKLYAGTSSSMYMIYMYDQIDNSTRYEVLYQNTLNNIDVKVSILPGKVVTDDAISNHIIDTIMTISDNVKEITYTLPYTTYDKLSCRFSRSIYYGLQAQDLLSQFGINAFAGFVGLINSVRHDLWYNMVANDKMNDSNPKAVYNNYVEMMIKYASAYNLEGELLTFRNYESDVISTNVISPNYNKNMSNKSYKIFNVNFYGINGYVCNTCNAIYTTKLLSILCEITHVSSTQFIINSDNFNFFIIDYSIKYINKNNDKSLGTNTNDTSTSAIIQPGNRVSFDSDIISFKLGINYIMHSNMFIKIMLTRVARNALCTNYGMSLNSILSSILKTSNVNIEIIQ